MSEFRLVMALCIVALIACLVMSVAFIGGAKTPDEASERVCLIQGGVPARNDSGRYVRCDFPLRVNTR